VTIDIGQLMMEASKILEVLPGMRPGQVLFNTLAHMDMDLANQIRGTDADPYYDDANLPKFYERVINGSL